MNNYDNFTNELSRSSKSMDVSKILQAINETKKTDHRLQTQTNCAVRYLSSNCEIHTFVCYRKQPMSENDWC